jgi:ATP-dependent DNA ligase
MQFCYPNKPIRIYSIAKLADSIDFSSWIVQPKWNGHRALAACDHDGNIIVYSRQGKPLTLAGSHWLWLSMLNLPKPWALDGELLRDGRMIIWDFSVMAGVTRIKEPYSERLNELTQLLPRKRSKDLLSIESIESLPAKKYKNFMLRRGQKELEGLVLKSAQATDLWGPYATKEIASQFKLRF